MPGLPDLRKDHLQFWTWLGDREDVTGVKFTMYEGYEGEGQFQCMDGELRQFAVAGMKTKGGVFKHAVVRTSDVVTAELDLGL